MRRLAGAALVAISMVLVTPVAARAHAGFVSSEPEPGSELGSAPGVVVLVFSEPINQKLSGGSAVAPDGRSFDGSPTDSRTIEIRLATNLRGLYRVTWTTVSTIDGHTLHGSFEFGVGVRPGSGTGIVQDEPGALEVAVGLGRAVEDLALFLATGTLVLRALGRRHPSLGWVRVGLWRVLLVATAAGVVVVIGEALLAAPSPSSGAIATYLTSGPAGVLRLLRPAVEAAALVAAVASPALVGVLVVVAFGLLAASGHAAVVSPPWLGIGIETAHLVSAACWAGGILALAGLRPPGGWLQGEGRALLERFTPVALVAFGVTAATGVLRGVQEVGSLVSLFTSTYGLTLIAKVLAIGVVVELSFLAWRRLAAVPRLEAVFVVAAVGAAGMLASFPLPPSRSDLARGGAPEPGRQAGSPSDAALTLGGYAGSVLLGLTLDPGEPGTNAITLFVLPLGGEDAANRVRATFEIGGEPLVLTACGATCREGMAELEEGERLTVRIAGTGGGTAIFEIPSLPAPEAVELVRAMMARMHALSSYRLEETLTSGGPNVLSEYLFQAPDRVEVRSSTPEQTRVIWIGTTQYLRRAPGERWSVSQGGPRHDVPSFIWDYFQPFRAARELGSARVDGAETTVVAFFGESGPTPVWFKLWVDRSGLVRRAEMRAQGHFMDHRYFAFDEPVQIEPPKGVAG